MNITIICSRLDLPGGTERASVNLANLLNSHGHHVSVIIADISDTSFYPISTGIKVLQKNLSFGITSKGNQISRKVVLYRDIQELQKMLKTISPQIIIGTEYHLTIASWLAKPLNSIVFAWEHHHINWLSKNRFWRKLFKYVYRRLHVVVCQNTTEKKLFEELGCNAVVIPYSIKSTIKRSDLKQKNILSICWLIKRKGVELIPSIAEIVFSKHKDWHWKLIGSGEEYENVKMQIHEKGLSENLSIESPVSSDLSEEYLNASIYVMTSKFECLPLVLLEANSYGVPCVAFDCPTGPSDIIEQSKSGFLVELNNIQALASVIIQLIEDENLRYKMGERASLLSQKYEPESIYKLWEQLFKDAIE